MNYAQAFVAAALLLGIISVVIVITSLVTS